MLEHELLLLLLHDGHGWVFHSVSGGTKGYGTAVHMWFISSLSLSAMSRRNHRGSDIVQSLVGLMESWIRFLYPTEPL
jgi:hypothetical protein